jgi:hypothetical protein
MNRLILLSLVASLAFVASPMWPRRTGGGAADYCDTVSGSPVFCEDFEDSGKPTGWTEVLNTPQYNVTTISGSDGQVMCGQQGGVQTNVQTSTFTISAGNTYCVQVYVYEASGENAGNGIDAMRFQSSSDSNTARLEFIGGTDEWQLHHTGGDKHDSDVTSATGNWTRHEFDADDNTDQFDEWYIDDTAESIGSVCMDAGPTESLEFVIDAGFSNDALCFDNIVVWSNDTCQY